MLFGEKNAIAGLVPCQNGTILLNGKDITGASIRDRIEAGISYIPEDRQDVGLVMGYNLKNNLALKKYYDAAFSHHLILDDEAMRDHGNRLIQAYDIRSSKGNDTIVRSMSGGNQQKAIIAREIDMNGRLIIFMQPTRGLDVGAISKLLLILFAKNNRSPRALGEIYDKGKR